MHGLGLEFRHFWDHPYVAFAVIILSLGILDMVYAVSPDWSVRRKVLSVFFWLLYPILVLTMASGRKYRKDSEVHVIYASLIIILGIFFVVFALMSKQPW